ncbi:unnamed protein product [Boreogadus saida]
MLLLLPLATLLLGGGTVLSAVSSGPPGSDRWLSSLSETDGYWGKFRDGQDAAEQMLYLDGAETALSGIVMVREILLVHIKPACRSAQEVENGFGSSKPLLIPAEGWVSRRSLSPTLPLLLYRTC